MAASSEIGSISPGIIRLPVQKMAADGLLQRNDPVAVEQPLEIRIQYGPAVHRQEQTLSITMRTPGDDEELALGWLYAEGILPAGIPTVTKTEGDTLTVILPENLNPDLSRSQRYSFTSSSCGVCGKTSLDSIHTATLKSQDTNLSILATVLYALPALLREGQDIFDATGGLHAAGLFDRQGRLLALREDIGRHNALDKLIGHALQRHWLPLSEAILLLSGRACFELIQKAGSAGIKMVAAVGPPSSLAVSHAEENDITLVGFLRQERFNIYSGAHRIHIKGAHRIHA